MMDREEMKKEELRQREEEAIRKIKEREVLMRQEEKDRQSTMDLMKRFQMLDQIGTSAATMDTTTTTDMHNTDTPNTTTLPTSPNDNNNDDDQIMMDNDDSLPIGSLPPPIPYSQLTPNDSQQSTNNSYEPPSLPP